MAVTSPNDSPEPCVEAWVSSRELLFRLCLRWMRGHRADAEDLLSEACLRAIENARRQRSEIDNPISFCATIIANRARDLKRRARSGRRSFELTTLHGERQAVTEGSSPDDVLCHREALLAVDERLRALPHAQQSALWMRTLGVEYPQIAGRLGTSEQNVRKLVQIARASLRAYRC